MMIVLVDNGHGISTLGKRSPDGRLREYKYCREIAARVVDALRDCDIDAHLLVPEDADISLVERAARANAYCDRVGARNVCLVSIHNNAAGNGSAWMTATGWEAWTTKGHTHADALAECLYDAATACLPPGTKIRTDMTDGDRDKESNFAILRLTKCPAVLTENLFQDSKHDVEYLLSEEGRKAITDLHVQGIMKYISKYQRNNGR